MAECPSGDELAVSHKAIAACQSRVNALDSESQVERLTWSNAHLTEENAQLQLLCGTEMGMLRVQVTSLQTKISEFDEERARWKRHEAERNAELEPALAAVQSCEQCHELRNELRKLAAQVTSLAKEVAALKARSEAAEKAEEFPEVHLFHYARAVQWHVLRKYWPGIPSKIATFSAVKQSLDANDVPETYVEALRAALAGSILRVSEEDLECLDRFHGERNDAAHLGDDALDAILQTPLEAVRAWGAAAILDNSTARLIAFKARWVG